MTCGTQSVIPLVAGARRSKNLFMWAACALILWLGCDFCGHASVWLAYTVVVCNAWLWLLQVLWYVALILGQELLQGDGKTSSVQFSSVAQSCPTLCDPMNWSTQCLPIHHWLNGQEFEQAPPGVGDGQRNLACCSPRGCKELDTIELLNWSDKVWSYEQNLKKKKKLIESFLNIQGTLIGESDLKTREK